MVRGCEVLAGNGPLELSLTKEKQQGKLLLRGRILLRVALTHPGQPRAESESGSKSESSFKIAPSQGIP
ncbi:hypothetical protein EVAR_906_1 [Eumeta japonica]|uniref:Uncharacterized protein n=1 Tax=Eumeta variegata TaxID=151549 RepID=A0A4C1SE10_EUMVA|nr:hypothetical protein EVAR_906_1 [Eumeta japonica]